jgi:hypothetical protein
VIAADAPLRGRCPTPVLSLARAARREKVSDTVRVAVAARGVVVVSDTVLSLARVAQRERVSDTLRVVVAVRGVVAVADTVLSLARVA